MSLKSGVRESGILAEKAEIRAEDHLSKGGGRCLYEIRRVELFAWWFCIARFDEILCECKALVAKG